MAPRRGGYSSSSSGTSLCRAAFADRTVQAGFAYIVVFTVIFLGIFIALFFVRKKSGAGKKLIGIPYIFAVGLILLSNIVDFISTLLFACQSIEYDNYVGTSIASTIFYNLGTWALLFVVVYTLNSMLREHHGGFTMVIKAICLILVGVMFAVTCGTIGLRSYNLWAQTDDGWDSNARFLFGPEEQLGMAKQALYLLSVIVGSVLSLMSIFAMRSRNLPGGDLLGWTIALTLSMTIWVVLAVVGSARNFQNEPFSWDASMAISFLLSFFQAMCFIVLLCIAKHVAWDKTAAGPGKTQQAYVPVMQQNTAYGYHGAGQQQDYYQQAPVYVAPKP